MPKVSKWPTLALFIFWAGCGKESPEASSAKPTYAAVRVTLAGQSTPNAGTGQIVSSVLEVSGCQTLGTQQFTLSGAQKDHIVNLLEGDSSCVLSLVRVTYKDARVEEVFLPQGTSGIGGTSGSQGVLVSQSSGRLMRVTVGAVLSSPLAHLEHATFLVAPAEETSSALAYARVQDFAGERGQLPKLAPYGLTDLGYDASTGKRQIVIEVECTEPLVLQACGGHPLLETRYRLLTAAEGPVASKAAAAAAVEATSGPIRPTLGHFYANGVRFTATLSESGTLSDLIFVVGYSDSFRVFEIPSSKVGKQN